MSNEILDMVALNVMGLVNAPHSKPLEEMEFGQRIIVARNGMFYNCKNDWLDLNIKLKDIGMELPYGESAEHLHYAFGDFDIDLVKEFVEEAKKVFPSESCGTLIFNKSTKSLRLQMAESISSSVDHINYALGEENVDEVTIGDIHSHPLSHAFFSSQDNDDDKEGIKLSIVVGLSNANDINSIEARLCINNKYVGLKNLRGHIDNVIRDKQ